METLGKYAKTKITPFGHGDTCRVFGLFHAFIEVFCVKMLKEAKKQKYDDVHITKTKALASR